MKAYMALSCKVGAFDRVLDEIIKMNVMARTLSEREPDVFLLFGPVDILVQFNELKDFDEFITKWFTPIRMITADEPLIERTQTWIVISEGKSFVEEPYAFLFLNTQPRYLEKVQRALQAIPQVLSADTVFGPYDVICALRAKNKVELQRLLTRVQKEVPYIQGTMTEIVASTAHPS
ncbi:MAG: Lrp/AsnC family transcriptional regulator [Candidatus Bathyarchaeia archaeon]